MTIRKIKSPYSYLTKIIILCIILLIGIGQIAHKNKDITTIKTDTEYVQAIDGIGEGKQIQVQGDIQIDNNFPVYTHSIILPNQAKIGLRSSTINLNAFSGPFSIFGTIYTIKKGMPIVDVEYIKNEKFKYIVKNNIYTFTDKQMIINLNNMGTIYSFGDTGNIYIVSDNIPVITIQAFTCNKQKDETNCEKYRNTALTSESDSFISEKGKTFYKIADGKWIIFNDTKLGYIIESNSDENIIDFSSTIQPIDTAYILATYKTDIFDNCNDINLINASSIQKSGDVINITVQGTDKQKYEVGCDISIDMRNGKGITNVSIF